MSDYRTWKTAVSTSHTDYETLNYFRNCGIQAVELSRDWQKCDSIDWQAFRKNSEDAGMEIWSYHLPFSDSLNIASANEGERKRAVSDQCSQIRKAADAGIRRFIIHPSTEPIPDAALEGKPRWLAAWNMSEARLAYYAERLKTMNRTDCLDAARRSLAELAEYAAQFDAVVCVENLPRTCLGHTVQEMAELTAADDRLRVCFDVNHLLTDYGSTHEEFVEKLGKLIVTTHMSDYDFIDEKHYFPGCGMLNWKQVVECLEKADYTGPFLFEGGFSAGGQEPDEFCGTFEMARERHMTIKQFAGKD